MSSCRCALKQSCSTNAPSSSVANGHSKDSVKSTSKIFVRFFVLQDDDKTEPHTTVHWICASDADVQQLHSFQFSTEDRRCFLDPKHKENRLGSDDVDLLVKYASDGSSFCNVHGFSWSEYWIQHMKHDYVVTFRDLDLENDTVGEALLTGEFETFRVRTE